jgi:outer membrane protein assembly factor BamB
LVKTVSKNMKTHQPNTIRFLHPRLAMALSAGVLLATLYSLAPRAVAQGTLLWSRQYAGPGWGSEVKALAVDRLGNVIVTGTSIGPDSRADYAIVKYSSTGVQRWANGYNGGVKSSDVPTAVGVDASGNVFVTGFSASDSGTDYATIKYSSAGALQWTKLYNGPAGGIDAATALAVDNSGCVIVTGTSEGAGSGKDWATVKYSSSGAVLWERRYDVPGGGDNWATAISVDSSNYVYVTGYNSVGDYTTVAYSSEGGQLWVNEYGPSYRHFGAIAVAVDNNGKVFVTGFAAKRDTSPLDEDYVTLAYGSGGVPLWTNRYSYAPYPTYSDLNDEARAMAVRNGRVFVTGDSQNLEGGYMEYATVAYSTDGVLLWTNRFSGGPFFGHNQVRGIAVDSVGAAVVTGLDNNETNAACATVAYSGSGTPLWTNRISMTFCDPVAIAADNDGNVFVTGTYGPGYTTIKLASSPPARLSFQVANGQLVLTWNNASCHLQSAPAINGPFADVPGANSPYTVPAGGGQAFFRLSCN